MPDRSDATSNRADSTPRRSAPNSVEDDAGVHDGTGSHSVSGLPATATGSPVTQGIVEEYDNHPNEYTIYSAPNREAALTTWISAAEGSYCSLAETR